HIGLPALGTGKGPTHVMHHPLLFHNDSLVSITPAHPRRAETRLFPGHGLQSGHFFLKLAMLSSSASYAFSLSTISCHVPVQRSWYWIFSGTSGQRSRCSVARSIAWAVCSTYATDLLLFCRYETVSLSVARRSTLPFGRVSSSARSTRRKTLPIRVLGSSLRNSICFGILNFARRFRQCSSSSVVVARSPSLSTTKALIRSPRNSSGIPMTQASLTFGCSHRHSSTSRG